jgi:molybdenum cofactor cytidylyltransferase
MGEPKQLLPWGDTTVIGAVVAGLADAGAEPVVCVAGHRQTELETELAGSPAIVVNNPHYMQGEMLSSYQEGVRFLAAGPCHPSPCLGALLALGDQPQIPVPVIAELIVQARATPTAIVIPSYNLRRGHPFFLPAKLWPELLRLSGEETLRTLLRRHEATIVYVEVETDAILRDIDTPEDYDRLRPPAR